MWFFLSSEIFHASFWQLSQYIVFSQLSSNFCKFKIFSFFSDTSVPPFFPARGLSTQEHFLVSLILPDFQFLFQFQVQVLLFTVLVSSPLACPALSLRTVCPTAFFLSTALKFQFQQSQIMKNKTSFVPFTSRRFSQIPTIY